MQSKYVVNLKTIKMIPLLKRKKAFEPFFVIICYCLFGLEVSQAQTISKDNLLQAVIDTFDLKPIDSKVFDATEKYKLGQSLFYDPILSGNRDVSCSTCHLLDYGSSDGLPLSIGVGGSGKGPRRISVAGREIHPRNSMDLWNRDHNNVSSMFWDGRVAVVNPVTKEFSTPLGARLPRGLENLMAVQSLFPLLTPDEMLGYPNDQSAESDNPEHNLQTNLLADLYSQTGAPILHSDEIFEAIITRLIGTENVDQQRSWNPIYLNLFKNAYPDTEEYNITHIGNALAHFIEIAFSTRRSDWDDYLGGDTEALSENEKEGALLFYGKGRCAVCHSGETFSDYDFHAVGVIDTDSRIMNSQRDVGRYAATGLDDDKYKFRTPPLRNVAQTSPYFHNGSVKSLFDAVKHHVEPLANINRYHESGRFLLDREQADAISPLLARGLDLSDLEVNRIVNFLNSLSYTHDEEEITKIVPENVPSKLDFLY